LTSNETVPKPVIGLIGGIGSGKSRVAEAFAWHGAYLISGDQLGHEALRQPDIIAQVVRRFGPEVLDEHGSIIRRRLGAVVFADPAERRVLEAMVFPWIERRFAAEVKAAQAEPRVALIVFDAAILLEAGWNKRCDWIVYVHAPREVRLQRLAEQRGWSAKEVEARENAQMPLTDKVTRADFVVDNSGPPGQLESQVRNLLQQWGVACSPGRLPKTDEEMDRHPLP
jgi:dephospho-CoA kinase